MTSPHQHARLFRRVPEGYAGFVRADLPRQCIDHSLSGALTSLSVNGPVIRHQEFRGALDGIHVEPRAAEKDRNGRAKPVAGRQWL